MNRLTELKRKFRAAWPHLNEPTRRIMAATEAVSLGYEGFRKEYLLKRMFEEIEIVHYTELADSNKAMRSSRRKRLRAPAHNENRVAALGQ